MSSNWRQRQKSKLRETLYEHALGLFRKHGYENVSVQRITDEVGVAKGTFYNHFRQRRTLLPSGISV